METWSFDDFEADPRQEALEEAAYLAWQFVAYFQQVTTGTDLPPVHNVTPDEWRNAHELVERYDIAPDEVKELARTYFQDTLYTLFPTDDLEFFQKPFHETVNKKRYLKARGEIGRVVSKRIYLEK